MQTPNSLYMTQRPFAPPTPERMTIQTKWLPMPAPQARLTLPQHQHRPGVPSSLRMPSLTQSPGYSPFRPISASLRNSSSSQETAAHHHSHPSTRPHIGVTVRSLTDQLGNHKKEIAKGLGKAGLIFTSALFLKLLPARTPIGGRSLLPVDWKAWAKIILGIMSVNQVNRTFDYTPKPWINGIQAVGMITAITQGFSLKSLKHFALMAPVVAGMVQGAVFANKKIDPVLEEKWNIPPIIPQLAISALMIVFGAKLSTRLLKAAGMESAGVAAVTCHNGCSPGSVVCLSEVGEMAGSLRNWIKEHWLHQNNNDQHTTGKPAQRINYSTQPKNIPTLNSAPHNFSMARRNY